MVPLMDDDESSTIAAVEFISKTFLLPAITVHPDTKIAEQNRKIAEQKLDFEVQYSYILDRIQKRRRSISEGQASKNDQRKARRSRALSIDEIKTTESAIKFISKSYSLEESPESGDPVVVEMNRLIAEQKRDVEAQRAEKERRSRKAQPRRASYQVFAGELRRVEAIKIKTARKNDRVFIKENLSREECRAIDLISKSISLTEDSTPVSREIVIRNHEIAEEKKLFEDKLAREKERALMKSCKNPLSEEDIKAEQEAIAFISGSYRAEFVAIHLDPKVVHLNRLVTEQKSVYESRVANKLSTY